MSSCPEDERCEEFERVQKYAMLLHATPDLSATILVAVPRSLAMFIARAASPLPHATTHRRLPCLFFAACHYEYSAYREVIGWRGCWYALPDGEAATVCCMFSSTEREKKCRIMSGT